VILRHDSSPGVRPSHYRAWQVRSWRASCVDSATGGGAAVPGDGGGRRPCPAAGWAQRPGVAVHGSSMARLRAWEKGNPVPPRRRATGAEARAARPREARLGQYAAPPCGGLPSRTPAGGPMPALGGTWGTLLRDMQRCPWMRSRSCGSRDGPVRLSRWTAESTMTRAFASWPDSVGSPNGGSVLAAIGTRGVQRGSRTFRLPFR
jgi:hypothetical protein